MANSKFRYVTGNVQAKQVINNVTPTSAMWECSGFLACNESFIAAPWASLGAVAVVRNEGGGVIPKALPLCTGHKGAVLDLAFHPFEKNFLFTASDDAKIKAFKVPDEGLSPGDPHLSACLTLEGHSKKCGILQFHPSAHNILASAAMDHIVNLWDVSEEKPKQSFANHKEQITSLSWNLDGTQVATLSKDKQLRIFDSRTGEIASQTTAHPSAKTQRAVWCKRKNMIVALGFNKSQFRQAMALDPRKMDEPLHVEDIDTQSSVLTPFFDEDTGLLYTISKGETTFRVLDVNGVGGKAIHTAFTFTNADPPTKGVAMMPKYALDVKKVEIAKFWKMTPKTFTPVSFLQPRRATDFASEIYPPTFAPKPALTASEFLAGKNAAPNEMDMQIIYDEGSIADAKVTASEHKAEESDAIKSPAKPKAEEPKKDSASSATASPAKEATPSPAKKEEEKAPAVKEEAPKPKDAVEEEPAWDRKSKPTPKQHGSQKDRVAKLKQQLEEQMKLMEEMDEALGIKKPEAAEAEAPKKDEEPKKEESKKADEAKEEPKKEESKKDQESKKDEEPKKDDEAKTEESKKEEDGEAKKEEPKGDVDESKEKTEDESARAESKKEEDQKKDEAPKPESKKDDNDEEPKKKDDSVKPEEGASKEAADTKKDDEPKSESAKADEEPNKEAEDKKTEEAPKKDEEKSESKDDDKREGDRTGDEKKE